MWLPLTAPRSLVTGDCTETPIALPTILVAVLQHAEVQSEEIHAETNQEAISFIQQGSFVYGKTFYKNIILFVSVGHIYMCRASKRCVKVAHAQRIYVVPTRIVCLSPITTCYNLHMRHVSVDLSDILLHETSNGLSCLQDAVQREGLRASRVSAPLLWRTR